jgi:hypothetical protein
VYGHARAPGRLGAGCRAGRDLMMGAIWGATARPHGASPGRAIGAYCLLGAHRASSGCALSWNGMQEVWGSNPHSSTSQV